MLIVFWTTLPVLLFLSAIASGTETALFSLRGKDRDDLAVLAPGASFAVERLLSHPRRLLIMVLVFNMTINVLYFVVSTLLSYRASSPTEAAVISTGAVISIVLFGEVLAKVIASSRCVWFARIVALPAFGLMRVGVPVWAGLDRFVVAPLARIVNPDTSDQRVDIGELTALVKRASGVLDEAECALLAEVVELRVRRAKDIMRPRVDLVVVKPDWTGEQIRRMGVAFVPVSEDGLRASIVGTIDVRRVLTHQEGGVIEPAFVPEMTTLDSVIGELGRKGTELVYVVDERGSVTGMITLDDIVDELTAGAAFGEGAKRIGESLWRVSGRVGVRDFAEEFEVDDIDGWTAQTRASTIGGLVLDALGRIPQSGDRVTVAGFVFTVHAVQNHAVESVDVQIADVPGSSPWEEGGADA